MTLWEIILILFAIFIARILYGFFIYPFVFYIRVGLALGFDKVALIYKPFALLKQQHARCTRIYGNSFGKYLQKVKQNPQLKAIVSKASTGCILVLTDVELVRKTSYDYVKNIEKNNIIMFIKQVRKGLLFSQGDEWKKSRQIISNIFHFQKLKERENVMEKVIEKGIKGLDGTSPNLFILGREIGGEIVVLSLFGEEFFNIRFGKNNPYLEIDQLINLMMEETFTIGNILRVIFQVSADKDSWFLTQSQKALVKRIQNFKKVTTEFLLKQKALYEKGKVVSPFIQVYFKQEDSQGKSDGSYIEELIHQLFFFLFAGEDTTGGLVEMCLAYLALHPQYQQRILKDVQATSIHSSKQLNNFINEVSRLKATINISFPRKVVKPFTLQGLHFFKGMELMQLLGGPMLNPRYWEDPQEFNPDRWNKPIENASAYLPFMTGPRNCIGQHMALIEIRILLVRILEKYSLEKIGNSLSTKSDNIINHLVDGKYVRFHKK